jgi:SAM-dependent methyltransferase
MAAVANGRSYQPAEYWSRRLAEHFDLRGTGHLSYSPLYNRWVYRRKRRILGAALEDVAAVDPALDVGAGTGWAVHELLKLGADVEGCDLTDVAVARLGERFPGSAFFRCELGTDPLPRSEAAYNLVTMLDVAYHITDDDRWARAVHEVARVLRPGGGLLVTDSFALEDSAPQPHVRFRSEATWKATGAAAGLRLRATRPLYSWLSRDRRSSRLVALPDGLRGAVEYALEHALPRPPHLRCATFIREGGA